MACTSKAVGAQILEALGLPAENCIRLTIEFHPAQMVEAVASYLVEENQFSDAIEIIRRLKPQDQQE